MYSDTLKPNISTLRESVIVVLSQAQSLMNYANQELVTLNSYAQHAKSIENEITKVKNLELRMAIVAPMKAGKSTIINAIVGQDILPSRQQAMTTLPTEIVFSKEVTEAKLMLRHEGSDAFDVLKQSWGSLKRKINQIGLEQAKERTKAYPHLQDLLEDVSDNPESSLTSELSEIEAIQPDLGEDVSDNPEPSFTPEVSEIEAIQPDLGEDVSDNPESSLTSELSEIEAIQPDLGEDVSDNPEPSFTPEVSGTEAIQTTLAKVNDLVRLCSALEPSDNPLMSLVSAPRIEVPFCQTESSLKLDGVGKLVFVDTPGPNEAGDMNLADVVKRQLESSAIILLVLDYTQLTTEAAEKVKRDVDEVAEIKGRESIYILINKVDMRKKKEDMTKQQVLEFVNNKFGIEASTNRVFEISASRAAYASNFWNEKKKGFTNPQDMRTSDLLGMQYYGDSWRKKFQKKVDMDDMEEAATDVWSESGFAEFLQKAIAALMIKAAPLTLLNALNDVRYGLTSLQNSINFQKNIFGQDVQKLQGQISALEHDLENLLDCQNKLKSQVKDIGKTLEQELITSLHNMKEQSSAELNNIFISREFSEAGLGKKFGRGILDMIQWFSNVKYQEAGLIEFNSQAEVDSFIEGVTASIRTITNNLMFNAREDAVKQINKSRQNIESLLKKETKPIVEQSQSRFKEQFNVNLELPNIFDDVELEQNIDLDVSTKVDFRYVYENEIVKQRRWYSLWIWKHNEVKVVEKTERFYTVSIDTITSSINQSISSAVHNVTSQIFNYLQEDFQSVLDKFFDNLDGFLKGYQKDLLNSIEAYKRSEEGRTVLRVAYDEISDKSSKLIVDVDRHKSYVNEFLPKGKQYV
jgi:hypothetical protein